MSTYLPTVFGENLLDVFDDFDRDFFCGFGRPEHVLYGKNASRLMKTDVKETDEDYEVDVDLPGFTKDEKKGKVLRQERYSGTMQRSFYVGSSITEEDIKAKYENGVLSLTLPKKEAKKVPEKKTILIEG